VTAYDNDERRRRASDLGARDFLANLTKPVDFQLLKAQLRLVSSAAGLQCRPV